MVIIKKQRPQTVKVYTGNDRNYYAEYGNKKKVYYKISKNITTVKTPNQQKRVIKRVVKKQNSFNIWG